MPSHSVPISFESYAAPCDNSTIEKKEGEKQLTLEERIRRDMNRRKHEINQLELKAQKIEGKRKALYQQIHVSNIRLGQDSPAFVTKALGYTTSQEAQADRTQTPMTVDQ